MVENSQLFFDERFLERHAGSIIVDPSVAIVELVANAWDAWATHVDIVWPERGSGVEFSIRDNGKGMTEGQFRRRWMTIDYNRLADEGRQSAPPPELASLRPREAYGRNGKGRHAAFRFGDVYQVRTWRDGTEVLFEVRRGEALALPFVITLLTSRSGVEGHGTEIQSAGSPGMVMTADEAREVIGARFLADPNFTVAINGTKVTFDDIPKDQRQEINVDVPGYGVVHLIVIDTQKADRTSRQHGIAWLVNNRLVGKAGWLGFDQARLLDGRSSEAKRFLFIVRADFLAEVVLPDWSTFDPASEAWLATQAAVHDCIRDVLAGVSADRRRATKEGIRDSFGSTVAKLPPVGRDRWNSFVDKVVDTCPTISVDAIEQVVLANLELATSRYGLIAKLHDMKPGDLDDLNALLVDWTVRTAKLALDEIAGRLKLIEELDQKLRDPLMDEVGDLQPLFERSLWVFGPEFESLEFTSNRGMTEVIAKIFGKKEPGSRQRPDFVMLPDGSVGLYSRDSHDLGGEVDGVARLVIAEIKKTGVTVGGDQKNQPWKYVEELLEKGFLSGGATVTCYVLGSKIKSTESGTDTKLDGRVTIIPMTYDTFIRRAQKRMLGLRDKLRNAPFLREHGVDADAFLMPPGQVVFDFPPMAPAAR